MELPLQLRSQTEFGNKKSHCGRPQRGSHSASKLSVVFVLLVLFIVRSPLAGIARMFHLPGRFHLAGRLDPAFNGLWPFNGRFNTTFHLRRTFDLHWALHLHRALDRRWTFGKRGDLGTRLRLAASLDGRRNPLDRLDLRRLLEYLRGPRSGGRWLIGLDGLSAISERGGGGGGGAWRTGRAGSTRTVAGTGWTTPGRGGSASEVG